MPHESVEKFDRCVSMLHHAVINRVAFETKEVELLLKIEYWIYSANI